MSNPAPVEGCESLSLRTGEALQKIDGMVIAIPKGITKEDKKTIVRDFR